MQFVQDPPFEQQISQGRSDAHCRNRLCAMLSTTRAPLLLARNMKLKWVLRSLCRRNMSTTSQALTSSPLINRQEVLEEMPLLLLHSIQLSFQPECGQQEWKVGYYNLPKERAWGCIPNPNVATLLIFSFTEASFVLVARSNPFKNSVIWSRFNCIASMKSRWFQSFWIAVLANVDVNKRKTKR